MYQVVGENEVDGEYPEVGGGRLSVDEQIIDEPSADEPSAHDRSASAERTQRTEWYTPSLFELSTDHHTTASKVHAGPDGGPTSGANEVADDSINSIPRQETTASNMSGGTAGIRPPSRIEQLIHSSKDGPTRLSDARLRPVTDIKKGLGLNEKFLLMRSFFNNDAMRFTADLDRLNRLNSLQEAEEMLFGSLLPGRHWDAQSEADLTLFLIIYRRFAAS